MKSVFEFCAEHPEFVSALVVLWALSFSKLTPPSRDKKVLFFLWCVAARMTFAAWDKFGGELKMPGTIFPELPKE